MSVPAAQLLMSKDELVMLQRVLDPNSEISTVIPKVTEPDEIGRFLEIFCFSAAKFDRNVSRLKPIIGHLLNLAKATPEVYTKRGFKTYEQFLADEIEGRWGISRSEAYKTRRLMQTWTADDWVKVGPVKLEVLSKFTNGTGATNRASLIKQAQSKTVVELKQWATEKGLINQGEADRTTISIQTTVEIAREWKRFINDPKVQEMCESEDPGTILLRAIEECSGSGWRD